MAKNKVAYALTVAASFGSAFLFSANTFAESITLESCDDVEETCAVVTSSSELKTAIDNSTNVVIVGADFDMLADYRMTADMTLYLNDHTVTSDGWSIINNQGTLVINAGENGKVVETGGEYAPFYIYGKAIMNAGTIEVAEQGVYVAGEGSGFTMYGGKITSTGSIGVTLDDGARFVLEDGDIEAKTWVVSAYNDTEFTMNGGTITTTGPDSIGVSGNGTSNPEAGNYGANAKFVLNAGTITSNDLGVYAPQVGGDTYLGAGLTIDALKAGVEVRAGTLTVDGATIVVDEGAPYEFNPNGSGSTATGVAIAVAQHTTKQAISANVIDGNFTAPVAFAEGNPQVNPEEDVEKVSLSITGGVFTATNGEPIVASEDVEKFITGGNYSKTVDKEYIADDYTEYELPDGSWTVDVIPTYTLPDAIYVQVGESVDVEGSVTPEYFAAGVVDSKATLNLEDGTVTGVEAGNTEIMISWYDIDGTTVTLPVYVYDITPGESEELENSDIALIQELAAKEVADFLANGVPENIYVSENGEFWNVEGLRAAIADGQTIKTALTVHTIDMNDAEWVNSEKEVFASELGENDQIAMIYFINIEVYVGDIEDNITYGRLTSVSGGVTLRLGIPAGLPEVAEGFKREFFAIRSHLGFNDATPTLTRMSVTVEGDEAVLDNDLFSDFVLAYTDTEEQGEEEPGEQEPGEEEPGEEEPGEEEPGEEGPGEEEPGEEEPGDIPGEEEEPTADGEESGTDTPNTGVATSEGGSATSSIMVFVATMAVFLVAGNVYKNIKRKNQRKSAQAKLTNK